MQSGEQGGGERTVVGPNFSVNQGTRLLSEKQLQQALAKFVIGTSEVSEFEADESIYDEE